MVDKDAVRRGYDGSAEAYAAQRPEDGRGSDVLDRFLRTLPESPRILDAGCGQGVPVLCQSSVEATAVGLDLSRTQLEFAGENAPDASLVQGEMTRLPLGDDVFDAVTAYHSLIHVPLDEHRTVVDEFARVLDSGGRLLVSEGPNEWSGSNPDWLETGVEMEWSLAGAEATREQLRSAGFTVDNEEETTIRFAEEDETWVFFSARLDA